MAIPRGKVLVLGVYLLNARNLAAELTQAFDGTGDWMVDQRWAAIGRGALPGQLDTATVVHEHGRVPKFELLNRLLKGVDVTQYDHLLVTDDDIELPPGFLDRYLDLVTCFGFSLSQPARTHDSHIDHYFVAALNGVESRQTRFVEIGPLFAVGRDAFELLLPFDEHAPMGWGLDSVWPVIIERAGLKMGIVDATPVRHAMRKPVSFYDYDETDRKRNDYLMRNEYLSSGDAFVALRTFPRGTCARARSAVVRGCV